MKPPKLLVFCVRNQQFIYMEETFSSVLNAAILATQTVQSGFLIGESGAHFIEYHFVMDVN